MKNRCRIFTGYLPDDFVAMIIMSRLVMFLVLFCMGNIELVQCVRD